MQKKWAIPIVVTSFGAVAIITAAALFEIIGPVWFGILLGVGILAAISGGYEFWRAFRAREAITRNPHEMNRDKGEKPEYRRKRSVLSRPEQRLLKLLKELLPSEHFEIFPETALTTVIDKLTQNSFRSELFRIADFCIADAHTTEPLLLIELNDASHKRADRAERDRSVADICDAALLPLVTFTLDEAEDTAYVSRILKKYLK